MIERISAFLRGFVYAARGAALCVKTQRNMRFHLCAAAAVIFLASVGGFGRTEFVLLILTIASVISAEIFNTAVEYTVDLCTREKHPLAGNAKDCAAGAVLMTAAASVCTGIILFGNAEFFAALKEWFGGSIIRYAAAAAYLVTAFLFVFAFPENKDNKNNDDSGQA